MPMPMPCYGICTGPSVWAGLYNRHSLTQMQDGFA